MDKLVLKASLQNSLSSIITRLWELAYYGIIGIFLFLFGSFLNVHFDLGLGGILVTQDYTIQY